MRTEANQNQRMRGRTVLLSLAVLLARPTHALRAPSAPSWLRPPIISSADAKCPTGVRAFVTRAMATGGDLRDGFGEIVEDNTADGTLDDAPGGMDPGRAARRAARKARKEAAKGAASEREQAGTGGGAKPCASCASSVHLLIRCQTDTTKQWKMLCGKCWHKASGGVPDGDADHPHYR